MLIYLFLFVVVVVVVAVVFLFVVPVLRCGPLVLLAYLFVLCVFVVLSFFILNPPEASLRRLGVRVRVCCGVFGASSTSSGLLLSSPLVAVEVATLANGSQRRCTFV